MIFTFFFSYPSRARACWCAYVRRMCKRARNVLELARYASSNKHKSCVRARPVKCIHVYTLCAWLRVCCGFAENHAIHTHNGWKMNVIIVVLCSFLP